MTQLNKRMWQKKNKNKTNQNKKNIFTAGASVLKKKKNWEVSCCPPSCHSIGFFEKTAGWWSGRCGRGFNVSRFSLQTQRDGGRASDLCWIMMEENVGIVEVNNIIGTEKASNWGLLWMRHREALCILSWVTHPQNKLTRSISSALQPWQTASASGSASAPEIQRANWRW